MHRPDSPDTTLAQQQKLNDALKALALQCSGATYSRHRQQRITDQIDVVAKIFEPAPQHLTQDILCDFLAHPAHHNKETADLTHKLLSHFLTENSKKEPLESLYRTLLPSLITGGKIDIITEIFNNKPQIATDLTQWLELALDVENKSSANMLRQYAPENIAYDLHIRTYNLNPTENTTNFIVAQIEKRYPDEKTLQEIIGETGDSPYRTLLKKMQHEKNVDAGWNYSHENTEEMSFTTAMQGIKLTRIFNFKAQQVTQVTLAHEKVNTDIQNFSDIEHDAEIKQARHYLNLIHGKQASAPHRKQKLSLPSAVLKSKV